jgi:hypothetical protein
MTIDAFTYIVLALAAFRVTRVITTDTVFETIRDRIWNRFPPTTKFGYLLTCNWCTGFWVSIGFVGLYLLVPTIVFVVSLVLSISAIVGLLSDR